MEVHYRLVAATADTYRMVVAGVAQSNYGIEIINDPGTSVARSDDGTLNQSLTAGIYLIRVCSSLPALEYALAIISAGADN